MISTFFSTIKGWLYAAVGLAGALLYGLLHLRTKQRDDARQERDAAQDDAESATEIANTQSELARAQREAERKTNDELEKPSKRPDSGTDFNSL